MKECDLMEDQHPWPIRRIDSGWQVDVPGVGAIVCDTEDDADVMASLKMLENKLMNSPRKTTVLLNEVAYAVEVSKRYGFDHSHLQRIADSLELQDDDSDW
jgi:hypothetical protein